MILRKIFIIRLNFERFLSWINIYVFQFAFILEYFLLRVAFYPLQLNREILFKIDQYESVDDKIVER